MKPPRLLPLAALALALALPAVPGPARADHEEKHYFVRVGDAAPRFELRDDEGKKWKLTDHLGKRAVVLFFYMGDYFPQSVREARAFHEDLHRLRQEGAEVIGVSGDTPGAHALFKRSYDLRYTLLSDAKGEVAWRFGMPISAGGSQQVPGPDGEEVTINRGATRPSGPGSSASTAGSSTNAPRSNPSRKASAFWPCCASGGRSAEAPA
jgi:peroxiredoxin Q/BCP